jgi:aminoglycoside phosphotransferase (APT) family kinase protein
MHEWAPERTVGDEDARHLIGGQFPEVDTSTMRLFGEGWDSTVWLVGGRWVFRFPRRSVVLPGFQRELAALPVIAEALPVPVPVATMVGEPVEEFPWPFAGAGLIAGTELAHAGLDDAARIRLAEPMARFLRALHDIDPAASAVTAALPVDDNRRADMPHRAGRAAERLSELHRLGLWAAPPEAAGVLADARLLPPPTEAVVVHGDLHLRHLLVTAEGGLTGVIDWIDIGLADPSVDLLLYWAGLPPAGRERFRETYGPIGDDRLLRARVLALDLSATLALYAYHEGDERLLRDALASLARTMA